MYRFYFIFRIKLLSKSRTVEEIKNLLKAFICIFLKPVKSGMNKLNAHFNLAALFTVYIIH